MVNYGWIINTWFNYGCSKQFELWFIMIVVCQQFLNSKNWTYIYIYYTLIPDFNSTLVLRLFEELYCLVIHDDISQLMGFRIPVGCCRGYILAKEMSGLMYI